MEPHELLKRLVDEAGGSLKVAKAMGQASFQGTLHKISHGNVSNPKYESAERISRHFGIPVQALYDKKVATEVAVRFGWVKPRALEARANSGKSHDPGIGQRDENVDAHQTSELTPEEVHAFYGTLSHAERRRFAIAVAYAFDPKLDLGGNQEKLWDSVLTLIRQTGRKRATKSDKQSRRLRLDGPPGLIRLNKAEEGKEEGR